jgi:hypothetical protein
MNMYDLQQWAHKPEHLSFPRGIPRYPLVLKLSNFLRLPYKYLIH